MNQMIQKLKDIYSENIPKTSNSEILDRYDAIFMEWIKEVVKV